MESFGTGVVESCGLPRGCWQLKPSTLGVLKPVLLVTESSLLPLKFFFFKKEILWFITFVSMHLRV